MLPRITKFICLSMLAILTVTPATAPQTTENQCEIARVMRLRKLHLVRPDLIAYPVTFDVYA